MLISESVSGKLPDSDRDGKAPAKLGPGKDWRQAWKVPRSSTWPGQSKKLHQTTQAEQCILDSKRTRIEKTVPDDIPSRGIRIYAIYELTWGDP